MLLSNITFYVIFAVLDVSFAVDSCINRGFLHIYLQFYYISAAVTWYRVHGIPNPHNFCGTPIDQQVPTKFATKAVIVTYCPNPRCVSNLKLLLSVVAEISRGSHFEIIP